MKTNEATKDQNPKPQTQASGSAKAGADKPKARTPKAKKEPAAKVEKDSEPVDRMPANLDELKESKSGLVTFLFLSGKEKDAIAKEIAGTFKLADAQAVKIVRRITGRARFFRRAFDLMAAK